MFPYSLRTLLILLAIGPPVLFSAFAQEAGKPNRVLQKKDPPATWKATELNDAMLFHRDPGSLDILVWEIHDDDHRIHERCLVIKRFKSATDRGETCALGYLQRFPNDDKREWKSVLIVGRTKNLKLLPPLIGCETYNSLPTDKEISSLLADYAWSQSGERFAITAELKTRKIPPPKLIDGGVCPMAWTTILGRNAPEDLFPELLVDQEMARP